MTETIYLYGSLGGWNEPHPYHDQACRCERHCGNCGADLDAEGRPARARYCSDYCKGRAARERAFDRFMQS